MARVGERREQVGVLLAPPQQVVLGDQAVGRARQAPVAVEAGPDEALVGQVVAGEQGRDPLVEGGLGERAGGREEAEDGPFDAVGERDRGGLLVLRGRQPPAAGLDLASRVLVGRVISSRTSARRRSTGSWAGSPAAATRGRPRPAPSGGAPTDAIGTAAGRRGTGAAAGSPERAAGVVGAVVARRPVGEPVRSTVLEADAMPRPARRPRAGAAARPDRARRGPRRGAARSGPARRGRAASRRPPRSRSAPPRPRRTAAGRTAPARRRGPGPGTRSGSPGPPGTGGRRRSSGSAGPAAARRPAAGTRRRRRPRRRRPRAGRWPGDSRRRRRRGRRRTSASGSAVDEQDRATVAGHRGRGGLHRAADRHGLPAPRRAQRRPGQRIDRQQRRRPRDRGPRTSRGRSRPSRSRPGRTGGWPRTRRIRGAGGRPAVRRRPRRAGGAGPTGSRAPGPPSRSPRRGSAGPRRAAPGAARGRRPRAAGRTRGRAGTPSSNASHGLRSRHWVAVGSRTWPPPMRSAAVRPWVVARRLAGRIACRNASRSAASTGAAAQVALDPVEDGGQADELARRVEREELVDEALRAVDRREPDAQRGPDLLDPDVGAGPGEVVVVERTLALLGAAALVAADRAAVVPGDRASPRPRRRSSGRRRRAAAQTISSTTSIRPQVAQRVAYRSPSETFRLDSRRGEAAMPWNAASRWRTSGGRSTTSASIRVSGVDFERDGAPLAIDRGAGDPAAAAEQVGDDVARRSSAARCARRPGPAAAAARTSRTPAARSRAGGSRARSDPSSGRC